jgi:hypothetical protein
VARVGSAQGSNGSNWKARTAPSRLDTAAALHKSGGIERAGAGSRPGEWAEGASRSGQRGQKALIGGREGAKDASWSVCHLGELTSPALRPPDHHVAARGGCQAAANKSESATPPAERIAHAVRHFLGVAAKGMRASFIHREQTSWSSARRRARLLRVMEVYPAHTQSGRDSWGEDERRETRDEGPRRRAEGAVKPCLRECDGWPGLESVPLFVGWIPGVGAGEVEAHPNGLEHVPGARNGGSR